MRAPGTRLLLLTWRLLTWRVVTWQVASDAYATARELLTRHRGIVARFLDAM